jgi:hypothetical protein
MQDKGASPRGDRATHEPSPSVLAVPVGIPSASGLYLTCRNCGVDRNGCARRAEIRARVKGLGITSLKFRCADRKPIYHAGQRVEVTWKYCPPDWDWEEGMSLETWPATVVQETKKGFLIAVDDVPSGNDLPAREFIKSASLYCNVAAGKLAPLNEPDRRSCDYCHSIENADGTVTGCWGVNGYDGMNRVDNCLAQAIEARRAETGTGSVHESAVGKADAPNPSSHPKTNPTKAA